MLLIKAFPDEVNLKIKVRYFTTLRELAGTKEEIIEMEEGSTIAGLIKKIALNYGEEAFNYLYAKKTGVIDPSIEFLVNGVSVSNLRGLETELKDGDIVAVIPPIGGG